MNQIKLVLDSSADLTELDGIQLGVAPLKIVTDQRQFVDDIALDVEDMADFMHGYKGTSSTSCPNTEDWIAAFGDAQEILCITITSALSGAYNSARLAKDLYEQTHPDRRVILIDSLSAGPEITLMAEKARELILAGLSPEEVAEGLKHYKTELFFVLESLQNFANNGRVSKLVAKTVGVLGIRVLGRASDEGTLEVLDKVRGETKSLEAAIRMIKARSYKGGRLLVSHCCNPSAADAMAMLLREEFPEADIRVGELRGLCSYYAERGGMLIGYEVTGE